MVRHLICKIKVFILIHWLFIIQIINGGLAGGRVHSRVLSCHKHQKSKLYIVSDIVPNIIPDIEVLFDILIINLLYLTLLYDIKETTVGIGPDIQIYPSLSRNIGPDIEYFL